ncbi:MAG: hypothetical protein IPJ79_18145 [Bacteroidetes bacterium]|nr:hypothetical protein [Bacteroidota bacterium]
MYAVGDFQGTVDFNPGAAVFNMTDAGGGYILKLTSAGNFTWGKANKQCNRN